ncbi:hypothetical protein [Halorubrum ezzemoulense]|uniref:Uncharacterized protein n=1 Tax=Halorubrum ezzemoulense TaxID=337243 RepID=A0A256JY61_HALEZ|nr:hypothetical protein [Halorubrum ezzemoulense]OYR73486.1 hypothetical protein DJ78_00035 [Halorubrum ezzemoulense]
MDQNIAQRFYKHIGGIKGVLMWPIVFLFLYVLTDANVLIAAIPPLVFIIGALALSVMDTVNRDPLYVYFAATLLGLVLSVAGWVNGTFSVWATLVFVAVTGWLTLDFLSRIVATPASNRIYDDDVGGFLDPKGRLNLAAMRAVLASLHETDAQTPVEIAEQLELTEVRVRNVLDWAVTEGIASEEDGQYRASAGAGGIRYAFWRVNSRLAQPFQLLLASR